MKLTKEQVKIAFDILKNGYGISGNDFARSIGQSSSNQSYWRKNGMSGASVAMLETRLTKKEWEKLTNGEIENE